MSITCVSTDVTTPSSSDMYAFETSAKAFLSHVLVHEEDKDGDLYGQHVLDTSVSVTRHHIQQDDAQYASSCLLECAVSVVYIGSEVITDLDHILEHATLTHHHDDEGGDGIYQLLTDLSIVDQGGTNYVLTFTDDAGEVPRMIYALPDYVRRSRADQSLIAACVVLVLFLVMVSCLLIWSVGGCIIVKSMLPFFHQEGTRQPYNQKRKEDESTAPGDTGSGILGAVPSKDEEEDGHRVLDDENSENLPPGFTPNGRADSEVLSPLSQFTNFTDNSSRIMPLGITSMRKLNRFMTPEKARKEAGAYKMQRLSYT